MDAAKLDLLRDLQNNLADVIDHVHQSLVQISNGRGAGAGTIWHSDGLIITNAHVVHGHQHLNVTLPDGRTLPTQVIAYDKDLDLAALSVNADNLPTIELGDSRLLKAGQWVMAVGHPWGVQGAITSGVVIGAGGDLPEMQTGREWIALDLHMRPGHSGGPLVDSAGRLVGINTMITGPDVGFAIPVQTVKTFLKEALGAQKVAV
jgi:S1-C subfamily serine protease